MAMQYYSCITPEMSKGLGVPHLSSQTLILRSPAETKTVQLLLYTVNFTIGGKRALLTANNYTTI